MMDFFNRKPLYLMVKTMVSGVDFPARKLREQLAAHREAKEELRAEVMIKLT